jgi:hypothetical protein
MKSRYRIFIDSIAEDADLFFFIAAIVMFLLSFFLPEEKWLLIAAPPAFIAAYLLKHFRVASQLVSTKHLPLIFTVGRPIKDVQNALETAQASITELTGFKAFRKVEKIFDVRRDLLLPHKERKLEKADDWTDYIVDSQHNIRQFVDSVPGEKVYHVFLYGPASLALGLGAVFGSKHKMVIYQRLDGQYIPVIDQRKNLRRIKQPLVEHKYITVSEPQRFTPDIALVLDMSSHPARGDVKRYINQQGLEMEVVEVVNTYGGNLTEDDWTPVVQEIYSVFNQLQAKTEITTIHLFHSMPVALAFGVGMALGNFVPVTVYNWEASEKPYQPVLKLNELKSIL